MSEHFANRYAIELGRCGINGTSYQVHARPEDLEALARKLIERVELLRRGEAPMQKFARQEGWRLPPDDSVLLLSEYVTLSQERTDRMSLSFYAEESLERHHVMKRTVASPGSIGLVAAKVLWFVVLPVVGVVALGAAAVRAIGG
jgi:hypothetical protein